MGLITYTAMFFLNIQQDTNVLFGYHNPSGSIAGNEYFLRETKSICTNEGLSYIVWYIPLPANTAQLRSMRYLADLKTLGKELAKMGPPKQNCVLIYGGQQSEITVMLDGRFGFFGIFA